MNTRVIRFLACMITGYCIYEAKAEDFIDFYRGPSLYAIGENQGPLGLMDRNFDENDVSGSAWYRAMRLYDADTIHSDDVLPDDLFPRNSNPIAVPLSSLAAYIISYTNRPEDIETDTYSMIFEIPAMYTIPQYIERGFGLEHRDAMFELGGPAEYNKARVHELTKTVPEPMVVSLIVISGIGILFARRMFRKI